MQSLSLRLVLGLATLEQPVLDQKEGKLQFLLQHSRAASMDPLPGSDRVKLGVQILTLEMDQRGQNVDALKKQEPPKIK